MEKYGNLLDADEAYIVQQCCCTSVKPHGLSAAIAERFPEANPYACRRRLKYNWARLEDRPQPGSVQVMGRVICLFGQYTHSKPGAYADPANTGTPDDYASRLEYFRRGLEEIARLNPASVAFPYRIGCGLAGGDWKLYQKAIADWSARNPGIRVTVYRLA